jgi:Holliday junction resolvasome RuvABC endonuclease subunit
MEKIICVLGISPGTRAMGFAVLKENKLTDWQIKSFKQAWSKHKATILLQAVKRLIKEYQVEGVAIKTIPQTKVNTQINKLIRTLTEKCTKESIVVHEYSIEKLKQLQDIDGKSKLALMHHVALHYPCLKYLYHKELANRNPYHIKVFEAVLAAHQCNDEINGNPQK